MDLYTQNEAARVAVERENRVAGRRGNGHPASGHGENGHHHGNGHDAGLHDTMATITTSPNLPRPRRLERVSHRWV
jgi:hypothetical protein